jgi:hypothetical protein
MLPHSVVASLFLGSLYCKNASFRLLLLLLLMMQKIEYTMALHLRLSPLFEGFFLNLSSQLA